MMGSKKCAKCCKSIYPNDPKLALDGNVHYHKNCARCATCNGYLSIKNFATSGDRLLCKTHFKEEFSHGGGVYAGGDKFKHGGTRSSYSAPTNNGATTHNMEDPPPIVRDPSPRLRVPSSEDKKEETGFKPKQSSMAPKPKQSMATPTKRAYHTGTNSKPVSSLPTIYSQQCTSSSPSKISIKSIGTFLLGFLSAFAILRSTGNNSPQAPKGQSKFRGTQYWKEGFTQKATTLYETSFARFQLHQVQLEDGKTVIDDWMWYDEGDNINVLVETSKGTFLVFQQTKYGLDGISYAVVGGLMEQGESPLEAAKREVQEELGLQAPTWHNLGAYRAAANRGGGTTHAFVCQGAVPIAGLEQKSAVSFSTMAEGESERQKLLALTRQELLEALMKGKFQEIKWTATVALALLSNEP